MKVKPSTETEGSLCSISESWFEARVFFPYLLLEIGACGFKCSRFSTHSKLEQLVGGALPLRDIVGAFKASDDWTDLSIHAEYGFAQVNNRLMNGVSRGPGATTPPCPSGTLSKGLIQPVELLETRLEVLMTHLSVSWVGKIAAHRPFKVHRIISIQFDFSYNDAFLHKLSPQGPKGQKGLLGRLLGHLGGLAAHFSELNPHRPDGNHRRAQSDYGRHKSLVAVEPELEAADPTSAALPAQCLHHDTAARDRAAPAEPYCQPNGDDHSQTKSDPCPPWYLPQVLPDFIHVAPSIPSKFPLGRLY